MGVGSEITQYINAIGVGPGQFLYTIVGGAVWMAHGVHILLLSAVAKEVQLEWGLSHAQRGSIVSIVFFGMFSKSAFSSGLNRCN